MSVNFYNLFGVMIGVDLHKGMAGGPYPHVVALPFAPWLCTFNKWVRSVTTDGIWTIQDGCDWYVVPHVPVPPQNPDALAKLPETIASSGSKAFMSVHSVTGGGSPLATTLWSLVGANANCQEYGLSLPTDIVVQGNSVKTTPTLGDYLGAAAGLAIDNVIGMLTELLVPDAVIKHILRRLPEFLKLHGLPDIVVDASDPAGQAKKSVQEWVDAGGWR